MIVIDSSMLVKYFSREPGWERVREVLVGDEDVATLDLALKEVANAFWKKIRREEATLAVAEAVLRSLSRRDAFLVEDQGGYLVDTLRIAVEEGITVYDALFIAFASAKGAALATSDERQASVAKQRGLRVLLL